MVCRENTEYDADLFNLSGLVPECYCDGVFSLLAFVTRKCDARAGLANLILFFAPNTGDHRFRFHDMWKRSQLI